MLSRSSSLLSPLSKAVQLTSQPLAIPFSSSAGRSPFAALSAVNAALSGTSTDSSLSLGDATRSISTSSSASHDSTVVGEGQGMVGGPSMLSLSLSQATQMMRSRAAVLLDTYSVGSLSSSPTSSLFARRSSVYGNADTMYNDMALRSL